MWPWIQESWQLSWPETSPAFHFAPNFLPPLAGEPACLLRRGDLDLEAIWISLSCKIPSILLRGSADSSGTCIKGRILSDKVWPSKRNPLYSLQGATLPCRIHCHKILPQKMMQSQKLLGLSIYLPWLQAQMPLDTVSDETNKAINLRRQPKAAKIKATSRK